MQEEKTILEGGGENTPPPEYEDIDEAFRDWWEQSLARQKSWALSREQVAQMAYGAGYVLGAKMPGLVGVNSLDSLPGLKSRIEEMQTQLSEMQKSDSGGIRDDGT